MKKYYWKPPNPTMTLINREFLSKIGHHLFTGGQGGVRGAASERVR